MTANAASIAVWKSCGLRRAISWRRLAVVSIMQGTLEMLEEWPLCPNRETGQGATLVQYVRLALT
jgi:hypothetical protein